MEKAMEAYRKGKKNMAFWRNQMKVEACSMMPSIILPLQTNMDTLVCLNLLLSVLDDSKPLCLM